MKKVPKKAGSRKRVEKSVPAASPAADFDLVLRLIDAARARAVAAVNTALIDLYWSIGESISTIRPRTACNN